jgi:hypothetical protein
MSSDLAETGTTQFEPQEHDTYFQEQESTVADHQPMSRRGSRDSRLSSDWFTRQHRKPKPHTGNAVEQTILRRVLPATVLVSKSTSSLESCEDRDGR